MILSEGRLCIGSGMYFMCASQAERISVPQNCSNIQTSRQTGTPPPPPRQSSAPLRMARGGMLPHQPPPPQDPPPPQILGPIFSSAPLGAVGDCCSLLCTCVCPVFLPVVLCVHLLQLWPLCSQSGGRLGTPVVQFSVAIVGRGGFSMCPKRFFSTSKTSAPLGGGGGGLDPPPPLKGALHPPPPL